MGRRLPLIPMLLVAALSIAPGAVAAQKSGDQSRLVFTVSGGYAFGKDLWSVNAQPIIDNGLTDLLSIDRALRGTWTAELGATYFPGPNLGFTVDLSFIDVNTQDSCQLLSNSGSTINQEVCASINGATASALSTAISAGVILRAASQRVVSPYLRVQGGIFIVNRSTTELVGAYPTENNELAFVYIYPSEGSSSISAEFALAAGVTLPISKAYHLRLEGRATTFGLPVVDAATDFQNIVPQTSTRYLTQFSILIGVDLVLEKKHGRRY